MWSRWMKDRRSYTIIAKKVIIATGLTNDPFIPCIPGSEAFQVPIFHQKQLSQYAEALLSSSHSSITVYGGAKSAYDAVASTFSRLGASKSTGSSDCQAWGRLG